MKKKIFITIDVLYELHFLKIFKVFTSDAIKFLGNQTINMWAPEKLPEYSSPNSHDVEWLCASKFFRYGSIFSVYNDVLELFLSIRVFLLHF